jgi:hypothetical protein
MATFLGDSFVKADGSSVSLDYVTRGKIVVVLYTAGIRLSSLFFDVRSCFAARRRGDAAKCAACKLTGAAVWRLDLAQIGDPGASPSRRI